jgi:hypothetical protein
MKKSTVHTVHNPLRIRVIATTTEARRILRGGYCPVECGFGASSVVCRLRIDHHGPLHELPGVAVRAYTESFGRRAARPWFAVTGYSDEDVTWAIGSLAGLLPHPSRRAEFRRAPSEMLDAWTRDWTPLAQLINRVDTDPTPIDLTASQEGRILSMWRLRSSLPLRDSIAFFAGIDRWRHLLTHSTDAELDEAGELLKQRLAQIRSVRYQRFGKDVVLIDSSIWGFAITYAWEWHKHFEAPILLVFQPRASGKGIVTACARDRQTAQELFGRGGLLSLFPRLKPQGWGGRPVIGGSSRGRPLTWEQARSAARAAASAIHGG